MMFKIFSGILRNKQLSPSRNICRSHTCQRNKQKNVVKTPYVYDGKGGHKRFGTYRNAYNTDEVKLTEECLQQNIIYFMSM